mgnify:CR=1 FL=1
MGATTVAAALSDFQAISQTVGTLKGGTVGADNLADELSSDLESQEAVVDKPVTAIVIGAGARGRTYASYSEHYPNSLKIVGVADINTERKEYMKNLYRIPDEHCFSDWKEVFNVPKFADAVIIATPDNLHYEPALKAMAAGYDLLLEKPVAQSIKECTDILKYAKRYDRIVGICQRIDRQVRRRIVILLEYANDFTLTVVLLISQLSYQVERSAFGNQIAV